MVVETLALLGDRPRVWGACSIEDVPAAFAWFTLDTDDRVGAIREDGRFAGFVGDLGFGLTKPMPDIVDDGSWAGAGFRIPDVACLAGAGVVFFAGAGDALVGFASRAWGLASGLVVVGDLSALAASLLAVAVAVAVAALVVGSFAGRAAVAFGAGACVVVS